MNVTINYVTGRTRTYTGVQSVATKKNSNGTMVIELVRSSGAIQTILISTISNIVYECTNPVQRVQVVFMQ